MKVIGNIVYLTEKVSREEEKPANIFAVSNEFAKRFLEKAGMNYQLATELEFDPSNTNFPAAEYSPSENGMASRYVVFKADADGSNCSVTYGIETQHMRDHDKSDLETSVKNIASANRILFTSLNGFKKWPVASVRLDMTAQLSDYDPIASVIGEIDALVNAYATISKSKIKFN